MIIEPHLAEISLAEFSHFTPGIQGYELNVFQLRRHIAPYDTTYYRVEIYLQPSTKARRHASS